MWPALAGLPVLIILLGLGSWQAERLVWKTDILARIAAAEAAPPAPISDPPAPYAKLEALGRLWPGAWHVGWHCGVEPGIAPAGE